MGVFLSVLFFALKLHEYYQKNSELSLNRLPRLSKPLLKEISNEPRLNIKNITYYENLFRSKKLFKILGKERTLSLQKKEESHQDLEKELSKFELLGIVSSGGKSQALIKDKESDRTYYLSGGEKVDGFIIKEVLSDKVIFKRGDWIAELRL
jgi:type II secretory pathway component PulC